MNIAYKLAGLLDRLDRVPARDIDFESITSEAFAAHLPNGKVIISWRGENYTRQRTKLWVKLHNLLIRVGDKTSNVNTPDECHHATNILAAPLADLKQK